VLELEPRRRVVRVGVAGGGDGGVVGVVRVGEDAGVGEWREVIPPSYWADSPKVAVL